MLTRRGILGALLAAPVIIRPGLLMPVKPALASNGSDAVLRACGCYDAAPGPSRTAIAWRAPSGDVVLVLPDGWEPHPIWGPLCQAPFTPDMRIAHDRAR